jgi:hypothetical protein
MIETTAPKQHHGFQKGVSGNPKGRPVGSRHKALVALDTLGSNSAESILLAVIRQAEAGDTTAARIILDRAWPARKGRTVAVDLPVINNAGGVLEALSAITAATAAGELSPDEAQVLAALIEAQRRAIETGDLAERIAALESRL